MHHHGEIDLVASQQTDELIATAHRHVEVDVAPVLHESTDQMRKEITARGNQSDPQTLGAAALETRYRLLGGFQIRQNHHAVTQQQLACLGQQDPPADMAEQRQPRLILHLLDLHRHGRLGEVQVLRRAGKAQMTRNTFESLQLPNCYVFHMKSRLLYWNV